MPPTSAPSASGTATISSATRVFLPAYPDFTGIVLTFDFASENLRPIDLLKFATIDRPYLNCRTATGALIQIPLFANVTQVADDYLPARSTFTLVDAGLQPFDRVTLCPTRPPASPPRASSRFAGRKFTWMCRRQAAE